MKMRSFLWVAVGLIIVVGLGTGGCKAKDVAQGGQITLRWSLWADAQQMEFWQIGIDDYKSINPNVSVIVENTPWAQYWDNLNVQIASNSLPDIFGMTSGNSRAYLASGVLLDLTDYMEKDSKDPDSGWDTSDFYDGCMDGYKFNGRTYAVAYDIGTSCIILNLKLFKEFGVTPPDENTWTFDDFRAIARKLTKDRDGDGVTDVYGASWTPYSDNSMWEPLILSLGSKFIVGEEPNQKIEIPEGTPYALQILADGLKEGWNYDYDQAVDLGLFPAGQVAMSFGNPVEVKVYKTAMETPDVDVVLTPRYQDAEYLKFLGGGGFSAAATTKYPDEVWKFLKNYVKKDNLKKIVADMVQGIPPRRDLRDAFLNAPPATPNFKAYLWHVNQNPVAGLYFTCPGWNEVNSLLRIKTQEVYGGVKTARQAMSEFVTEGNAIIAKGD
jgi:multiple sugar transport system substrate-binding protein